MASQGDKASVPPICTCVWATAEQGERTWERRDERERLCALSAQHPSPSWGCCDYLVEIATLSTQTKSTMANDPWTGIDSCRKCRQCSLHPEWIRYLHCIGPCLHSPTHLHTPPPPRAPNVIYLVVFRYQARMLSAGRVCQLHNESGSESPNPLFAGAKWWAMVVKLKRNNTQEVFKGPRLLCLLGLLSQLHLVEQVQEAERKAKKFKG